MQHFKKFISAKTTQIWLQFLRTDNWSSESRTTILHRIKDAINIRGFPFLGFRLKIRKRALGQAVFNQAVLGLIAWFERGEFFCEITFDLCLLQITFLEPGKFFIEWILRVRVEVCFRTKQKNSRGFRGLMMDDKLIFFFWLRSFNIQDNFFLSWSRRACFEMVWWSPRVLNLAIDFFICF